MPSEVSSRVESAFRLSWTQAVVVVLGLVGVAALVTSCAPLSSRLTDDPGPAVARLRSGGTIQDEVDRLVRPLTDAAGVHGVVVGVITADGISSRFAYGNIERPDPNTPKGDTIFQIGSLSKVFVASLLAILVEDGTLRYSDSVRSIVPSDVPLSHDIAEVTLYELVTSTSGLPREPVGFEPLYYLFDYFFTGDNLYAYIDRPYLYEYLRTCRLIPKARRTHVYSNLGMALLAHLIELKTHRRFPELLAEKISRPLNMRDTSFVPNAEQHLRLATGHVGDQPFFRRRNTPLPPWEMGEIMQPSGGLYSTLDDLMIFANSNLGMLGHPLDAVMASTHGLQIKTGYDDVAFGWLIDNTTDKDERLLYMHGMVAGYSAYLGMNIEKGVAVIVLCDSFNWDDKIGHNLVLRISKAAPSGRLDAAVNGR